MQRQQRRETVVGVSMTVSVPAVGARQHKKLGCLLHLCLHVFGPQRLRDVVEWMVGGAERACGLTAEASWCGREQGTRREPAGVI